jgi:hypothetical protein
MIDRITRGTTMISGKTRFLSAAVVAVALLATVAVARTVHTHAASADPATTSSAIGADSGHADLGQIAPTRQHRTIACPLANEADCQRIEMLLPN